MGQLTERAAAARRGMFTQDEDGAAVAVLGTVEGVDLVVGRTPAVKLDAAAARAMLRFLLRWWVGTCWCGLREVMLRRGLRRSFERAGKTPRQLRGDGGPPQAA